MLTLLAWEHTLRNTFLEDSGTSAIEHFVSACKSSFTKDKGQSCHLVCMETTPVLHQFFHFPIPRPPGTDTTMNLGRKLIVCDIPVNYLTGFLSSANCISGEWWWGSNSHPRQVVRRICSYKERGKAAKRRKLTSNKLLGAFGPASHLGRVLSQRAAGKQLDCKKRATTWLNKSFIHEKGWRLNGCPKNTLCFFLRFYLKI